MEQIFLRVIFEKFMILFKDFSKNNES